MLGSSAPCLLPRYIRLRDAPFYLGMDRHCFNTVVRPHLTEIIISKQAIAFDRLEIEAWADYHKSRSGRPAKLKKYKLWDENERPVSTNVGTVGTLIKKSSESAFAKAVAQVNLKKQKSI